MLRRASLAFVLCALALTAVAAAQPPAPGPLNTNLLLHHRVFQGREVEQVAVLLDLGARTEGWASAAELRDAQVEAALDWFRDHGYLFDDPGVDIDFSSSSNGNTLTISGPGFEIVINLPGGGPFIPMQREQLMVATSIRTHISNGF